MDLPGRQDELVRAVAAANPRTVVVVNAGSPVTMDWVDDVAAVVYAFFPGQELGDALADVLCGAVEPTGRLPVTVPVRLADTPAYLDHPGPGGTLRYGEGVFVGHRWYSARDVAVRFPFGHGLAYTTFALDDLAVSGDLAAGTAVATVAVTNRGDRPGRAVVQCYVAPPPEQRWRPRVLAGFAAVELAPGAAATVTVALDRRAAQVWRDGWRTIPGTYTVHAGRSAGDLPLAVTLDVAAEP
jgi:beta-glucosidase